MNKLIPLAAFGLGLIVAGAFFTFYNEALPEFDEFLIEDEYYTMMKMLWDGFPGIIMIVGIVCLIAAGVGASKNTIGDMY